MSLHYSFYLLIFGSIFIKWQLYVGHIYRPLLQLTWSTYNSPNNSTPFPVVITCLWFLQLEWFFISPYPSNTTYPERLSQCSNSQYLLFYQVDFISFPSETYEPLSSLLFLLLHTLSQDFEQDPCNGGVP